MAQEGWSEKATDTEPVVWQWPTRWNTGIAHYGDNGGQVERMDTAKCARWVNLTLWKILTVR